MSEAEEITLTTADTAIVSTAAVAAAYTVKNFIDAGQLRRDLAFSNNDLSTAMMEQSALFAHYGVLSADASRQEDVVKMLLENTEAAVYKITRDDMTSRAEKFTEPLLEKMVARHSRVIAMKKALNEAKRIASIGKTATESFRHRRDMLIQIGMISREEMKGNLFIAERSVRDDAATAQKGQLLERLRLARDENA